MNRSRLGLTVSKAFRDFFLILTGFLTLSATPYSIERSDLHGFLATTWSVLLIAGAIMAAVGVALSEVRQRRTAGLKVEIIGCILVGLALVVWGVALVTQEGATQVQAGVATLCWAGTAGQFYRVFGIIYVAGFPRLED